MTRIGWARAALIGGCAAVASGLSPTLVNAHPLGNFSINHYNGLTVSPGAVVIDHVLDMSEIPTFTERAAMDVDRDGDVSDVEAGAWAAEACATTADALLLRQDASDLRGSVASSSAAFEPGQGALTLRLECRLDWPLATPLAADGQSRIEFADDTYSERIGWREVVVSGDGVAIEGSDAPSASVSDRLLAYPPDPLAAPATQSSATFSARAADGGGPSRPMEVIPPATSAAAGDESLPDQLTALLEADELDMVAFVAALAVALGLGALHALSPGHGKTVMAAYLVGSRGTVRTAVGLGLVVTISHTVGVLALGLVTLGASSVIPLERLYPILGLVSGLIVLTLGAFLLWGPLTALRRAPAHEDHGHDDHHVGHTHDHGHEHAHGHGHVHGRDSVQPHRHPHPDPEASAADGWHTHGGLRHRHVLPERRAGWRGLASLGLAGGMVPSASALILLLGAVSVGRPELGIILTFAFGVGMALVLAGLGVAVIVGRGAFIRLGGSRIPGRLVEAVPALAGGLVVVIGIAMTAHALVSLDLVALG